MTLIVRIATFALATGLVASCGGGAPEKPAEKRMPVSIPAPVNVEDSHTFARPAGAVVKHVSLDLDVDFESKRLSGSATLTIENRSRGGELILDTNALEIRKVTLDNGEAAEYALGDEIPPMGRPLSIHIRKDTSSVRIEYATSPHAEALQWLSPEQTAGKKSPFLFTQSQAILARSWIPLQDSPGIRVTYDARVRVPSGFLAVMSAENPTSVNPDGVYEFQMAQPIPAYLFALAVGDIAYKAWAPNCGVYAEPATLEAAANEFADTPAMIAAAEKLFGPYRWGRYDMIVLPPSFPFGGMENPRLTFVTPTTIAGDRSLVSLIAHELAHSWSGNLVTNASWNDVWLNEGFTSYIENRIMEEVYGPDYADMLLALNRQDLLEEAQRLGPGSPDIALYVDMKGRDPSEGSGEIPYSKGMFLLELIEKAAGRSRFDAFLREYFDTYAFKPMDTKTFLTYLRGHLLEDLPGAEQSIRIDEWVYKPTIPDNLPAVSSKRFEAVDAQIAAFAGGAAPAALATTGWTTHEWLRFIRNLPTDISVERMTSLDDTFHFNASKNSEVLSAWLILSIRRQYEPAYPVMERFLESMGRRKFLQPIFEELVKTPEGKARALRVYRKARPTYHSVSRGTIDGILGWQDKGGA